MWRKNVHKYSAVSGGLSDFHSSGDFHLDRFSVRVVGQILTKHELLLLILVRSLSGHFQDGLIRVVVVWLCLARNVVVHRTEEVHDGLVGVEALIG